MAAITRLSVDGYGARRAGSFAGKEGTIVVVVAEENSGGWPVCEPRPRKKKEEDRAEIILEDIPAEEQQPEQKPKRPRLKIGPKPHILSLSEIDQILASVQGEIDQEIAIYLRAIEKRRRRNLALVLLLDAA